VSHRRDVAQQFRLFLIKIISYDGDDEGEGGETRDARRRYMQRHWIPSLSSGNESRIFLINSLLEEFLAVSR
jgi:hypothetical protein